MVPSKVEARGLPKSADLELLAPFSRRDTDSCVVALWFWYLIVFVYVVAFVTVMLWNLETLMEGSHKRARLRAIRTLTINVVLFPGAAWVLIGGPLAPA